jgi:hypothetical protein
VNPFALSSLDQVLQQFYSQDTMEHPVTINFNDKGGFEGLRSRGGLGYPVPLEWDGRRFLTFEGSEQALPFYLTAAERADLEPGIWGLKFENNSIMALTNSGIRQDKHYKILPAEPIFAKIVQLYADADALGTEYSKAGPPQPLTDRYRLVQARLLYATGVLRRVPWTNTQTPMYLPAFEWSRPGGTGHPHVLTAEQVIPPVLETEVTAAAREFAEAVARGAPASEVKAAAQALQDTVVAAVPVVGHETVVKEMGPAATAAGGAPPAAAAAVGAAAAAVQDAGARLNEQQEHVASLASRMQELAELKDDIDAAPPVQTNVATGQALAAEQRRVQAELAAQQEVRARLEEELAEAKELYEEARAYVGDAADSGRVAPVESLTEPVTMAGPRGSVTFYPGVPAVTKVPDGPMVGPPTMANIGEWEASGRRPTTAVGVVCETVVRALMRDQQDAAANEVLAQDWDEAPNFVNYTMFPVVRMGDATDGGSGGVSVIPYLAVYMRYNHSGGSKDAGMTGSDYIPKSGGNFNNCLIRHTPRWEEYNGGYLQDGKPRLPSGQGCRVDVSLLTDQSASAAVISALALGRPCKNSCLFFVPYVADDLYTMRVQLVGDANLAWRFGGASLGLSTAGALLGMAPVAYTGYVNVAEVNGGGVPGQVFGALGSKQMVVPLVRDLVEDVMHVAWKAAWAVRMRIPLVIPFKDSLARPVHVMFGSRGEDAVSRQHGVTDSAAFLMAMAPTFYSTAMAEGGSLSLVESGACVAVATTVTDAVFLGGLLASVFRYGVRPGIGGTSGWDTDKYGASGAGAGERRVEHSASAIIRLGQQYLSMRPGARGVVSRVAYGAMQPDARPIDVIAGVLDTTEAAGADVKKSADAAVKAAKNADAAVSAAQRGSIRPAMAAGRFTPSWVKERDLENQISLWRRSRATAAATAAKHRAGAGKKLPIKGAATKELAKMKERDKKKKKKEMEKKKKAEKKKKDKEKKKKVEKKKKEAKKATAKKSGGSTKRSSNGQFVAKKKKA